MATRSAQTGWPSMDTLFNVGTLGALTDRGLLDRFRDAPGAAGQEAFRVLVERHGPMVLGFCRSLLEDPHEADDALQATFLVLVRRARSIWIRDSIGPWLYAVAGRVARRALRRSRRRQKHEVQAVAEIPCPDGSTSDWQETYQGIHEEIVRLPAALRGPIVLCCLEGLTYDLAAKQLGVREFDAPRPPSSRPQTTRLAPARARARRARRHGRERAIPAHLRLSASDPGRIHRPVFDAVVVDQYPARDGRGYPRFGRRARSRSHQGHAGTCGQADGSCDHAGRLRPGDRGGGPAGEGDDPRARRSPSPRQVLRGQAAT